MIVLFRISTALLLLTAVILGAAAQEQVGWSTVDDLGNNGTTGGAGGPEITVTTFEELEAVINLGGPHIIYVSGTITIPGGGPLRIEENNGDNGNDAGNKSIIGLGSDAVIHGEIRIRKGAHNIIIRNIKFDGQGSVGDGVSLNGESSDNPVHHIWIDHCDFTGFTDGATDITHAPDYVTLSWNHYYGNARTSLIGHSDNNGAEDSGHLKVTFHHNWFEKEIQRQPRVRFSFLVHVFNNFYDLDETAIYAVAAAIDSHILLENNYFKNVQNPFYSSSGYPGDPEDPGFLVARGNEFENSGPTREENGTVPEASDFYSYTLDPAADIPALVMANAGVGKIATGNDTEPPTPNPLTWDVEPAAVSESSITMTATTATDPSGVEYYFANQTDPSHDSGWQNSPSYTDTGLTPATQYTYAVQARDKNLAQNTGDFSAARSATTLAPDTTPPTPDPMTWAAEPFADGLGQISMTATAASDPAGVEYFFTNLTAGGHNSGWQDSPSYTDTGLAPETQFAYQVIARDKSAGQNATAPSPTRSATTEALPPVPAPVAHWKFDESSGTVAAAEGSAALNGSLINMSDASWVEGVTGNALQFDGVDDQVDIPDNAAINFGAGPFSISFWLRHGEHGDTQYIYLLKGSYASGEPGAGRRYELYTKENQMRFAIDDDTNKSEVSWTDSGQFFTGDWVHVIAVRDTGESQLRIYADGQLIATSADGTGNIDQTEPLRLGRQPYTEAEPFDGGLDDLRLFNAALSDEQAESHYVTSLGNRDNAVPGGEWSLYDRD